MQRYLPNTGSETSLWNLRQKALAMRLQSASHKLAAEIGHVRGKTQLPSSALPLNSSVPAFAGGVFSLLGLLI